MIGETALKIDSGQRKGLDSRFWPRLGREGGSKLLGEKLRVFRGIRGIRVWSCNYPFGKDSQESKGVKGLWVCEKISHTPTPLPFSGQLAKERPDLLLARSVEGGSGKDAIE